MRNALRVTEFALRIHTYVYANDVSKSGER